MPGNEQLQISSPPNYGNQFNYYDLGTHFKEIHKLYQYYLEHAIRRQLMIYHQEIVRNDVGT